MISSNTPLSAAPALTSVQPLCPYFGPCGGCLYQDISYADELILKRDQLAGLFSKAFPKLSLQVEAVIPSPSEYHYRHRLDMTLKKTRDGILMGYQPEGERKIIEVESCAIARREVSDFLPELKRQAIQKLPEDYRTANLVVRTGDDGRVLWGGIGRRSLETPESELLWTEIEGRRIYFSLDNFFQANLDILPQLMKTIAELAQLTRATHLLDLYAGVGLFGVFFANSVASVKMVEDCLPSIRVMKKNIAFHGLDPEASLAAKVEEVLPGLVASLKGRETIAIVDPPRKGLHEKACRILAETRDLSRLLYLSCNPESLVRDLQIFIEAGWNIERVIPLDFFPRTKHLETLVRLVP